MENVMHRIQCEMNPDDPDIEILPCKCFDLIGGSDTGGILAAMFGKLRMSVKEAYDEFDKIRREVYIDNLTAEDRTRRLRDCIEDLLKRRGHPTDLKLRGKDEASCFVVATLKLSINNHIKLRSYVSRSGSSNDVTVVEAILATCATRPFFLPVIVGTDSSRQELIGGIMGAANPCREVIAEASGNFKGSPKVSVILSIGSGHLGTLSAPTNTRAEDWATVLRSMVTNSEKTALEMEERMGGKDFYFRLSVDQGLQRHHGITGDDPLWVNAQTEAYLDSEAIGEKLDSCVEAICLRPETVVLKDLGGLKAPKVSQVVELQSQLVNEKEARILEHLKPADLKQDSLPEECMPGTRQDILSQVEEWIEDTEAPNILWIKGYPGVGKSALASTIVHQLRQRKRLGFGFFFRRAEADISTAHAMWRFIAYKLALRHLSVKASLVAKLEADEDLPRTGNIETLFEQLISRPLEAAKNISIDMSPVIVIDALDECGGLDGHLSQHRRNLLLSIQKWSTLPKRYKIIVTSRGEHDIDCSLREISRIINIPTGLRVSEQSSRDITVFMTSRFKHIANRSSGLPNDWPGPEVIQELVGRANGLFIWAKLVADFVDRGEPEEQLSHVQESDNNHGMPGLYSQILRIAFHEATSRVLESFHAIMGAIIFLKAPLSASSLAQLLSMKETKIGYMCDLLKPVVESGEVLQIAHQSFVDFLLDEESCPSEYHIKREHEELRLTLACFSTMKNGLRFNICDVESSYLLNTEVGDLDERITRNISEVLSYSSLHWAHHLSECSNTSEVGEHIHHFMEIQFLYWLEILSLAKQMNTASTMLSLLIGWMKKYNKPYELPMDLRQFVQTFASIISQSVPHIYISALPFAPRTATVSQLYMPSYPHNLEFELGGLEKWPIFHIIMYGHSDWVCSVDFSPDGLYVVSGSCDGTIKVWDAETGEMIRGPLRGHTDRVYCVAFSPEEKIIASGSRDGTVLVWNFTTGEIITGPFKGHNDYVLSVAFSPEGRRIVSSSSNGTIIIWDAQTGGILVGPFIGHDGPVPSVAFSPGGQRVASGCDDNTITIWDAKTGIAAVGPFKGHTGGVSSVAFSPDGQRVVSGSYDKTVRVWNANTGHTVAGPFEGHTGAMYSVAFSPDGRIIASGSVDETVRIWDASTGSTIGGSFDGHTAFVRSVAFSPDRSRIVSGACDNTVRVWDVDLSNSAGKLFQEHTEEVRAIAFSPNGSRIVSGSEDCTLRIWDAQTGKAITEPLHGHSRAVNSVGFSPDGKRIVSGSEDYTVKLWDDVTGLVRTNSFEGHTASVSYVAFSPNGQRVMTGSWDDTVIVWDAETGDIVSGPFQECIQQLPPCIGTVIFSPDERRILSVTNDGTVKVWDVDTGELMLGPLKELIGVRCAAFSPSGSQIVTGGSDRIVRVWDFEMGDATSRSFEGHGGEVFSVSFSGDGWWIVSGSWNNEVIVWSVETGEIAWVPFIGHTRAVLAVAFSPDGQWIVSGSIDKTIRVWKAHPPTQRDSPFTISSILHEAWILDSQHRRLFWVPPTLRDGLLRPDAEYIIGNFIKTRLNLDLFVHGERWALCRSSGLSAS